MSRRAADRIAWACCVVGLLLMMGCHKKPLEYQPTPYDLQIPKHFPTLLNIPADNPMTVEGVALGKRLFHDTQLGGYQGSDMSRRLSCATCHDRQHGYDVGPDNPRLQEGRPCGANGPTRHNALPLCNLVFNREGYLWNGAVSGEKNIEDIVLAAITAEDELAADTAEVVARIAADPEYREMFRKAFGTEAVTMDRIQKAIAQYVRSLVSANSRFDQYLRGETQLTEQELRGYVLFTTEEGADCFHCHGGAGTPLFTTNQFYNNALDATLAADDDRYSVTGDPQDIGAYRAPTMRNIAVSGPYMHDGRFRTLDEVLEFYNSGLQYSEYVHPYMHKLPDGGAHLTPSDIAALKAFLNTLTDEEFIQEN